MLRCAPEKSEPSISVDRGYGSNGACGGNLCYILFISLLIVVLLWTVLFTFVSLYGYFDSFSSLFIDFSFDIERKISSFSDFSFLF